jgi:hypothetical protein
VENNINKATSEDSNKTSDKAVNRLITEMSHNCASVSIDVSLADVASILQYLSQCDFAQGESGNELQGELCFGRSYLLRMLGVCIHHFHENAENVGLATDHLNNIITLNNQSADNKIGNLVKLHGLYKALIEHPENGSQAELSMLKADIMSHESSLSLSNSDALAGFKLMSSVDGSASSEVMND